MCYWLFAVWKRPYLEFFWSVFSRIWTEYGVRTRKSTNTDTFHAVTVNHNSQLPWKNNKSLTQKVSYFGWIEDFLLQKLLSLKFLLVIRSLETFTSRILQIFIRIQKFRNRGYQENINISKGMVQKHIQSLVKQLRSFLAENKQRLKWSSLQVETLRGYKLWAILNFRMTFIKLKEQESKNRKRSRPIYNY